MKDQLRQKDAELAERASNHDSDVANLREELESKSTELATHSSQILRISSNRFEMFERIGVGSYGEVLEGKVRVAAKRLHHLVESPHNLELFQREMTLLAEVRHPNFVQFIGTVLDQSSPVIIMELLDMNLRQAYEQNLLRQVDHLSIFNDVAKALDYLHRRYKPIIHQNVSTTSILLQQMDRNQWKAKVCDLGQANFLQNPGPRGMGGPYYSAPEVSLSSTVRQTVKIDVYSFGIVLYEVTVSQFPDKYLSMIRQVQREHPPLHELIDRCTKRDPSDRPTMAEVLVELNKMASF